MPHQKLIFDQKNPVKKCCEVVNRLPVIFQICFRRVEAACIFPSGKIPVNYLFGMGIMQLLIHINCRFWRQNYQDGGNNEKSVEKISFRSEYAPRFNHKYPV